MKVVSDNTREVVRHFRTLEIEDGPQVDCGDEGPHASYFPGTIIRVDKIKLEWVGDADPETVEVSGPYVGVRHQGRNRYSRRYRMDSLPGWLWKVIF
jgi:hypothetical protein